MRIDLTAEERKALMEICKQEIELSSGDMGPTREDTIIQTKWITLVEGIRQKLKKAG